MEERAGMMVVGSDRAGDARYGRDSEEGGL